MPISFAAVFISIFILSSYSQAEVRLKHNQTVYVYEQKGTIWHPSDLGLTYKDCEISSAKTINACDRRLDWPEGGTALKVRNAAVKIDGKKYAYVKVGQAWGWTDVSYLNQDGNQFKKPAYLYKKPGYDYARCTQSPRDPMCADKNKIYIKEKTKLQQSTSTEVAVELENGEEEDEAYVLVEYESKTKGKVTGWMQKSSLSTIVEEIPDNGDGGDSETASSFCVGCWVSDKKDQLQSVVEEAKEFLKSKLKEEELEKLEAPPSSPYKDDLAFERFACLYSSEFLYSRGFSKEKFCQFYKGRKPNFKEQISKAAKAFSLPESLIGCTILVESDMFASSSERDEYRGYGQFGRAAVTELGKKLKSTPYNEMWSRYAPKRSVGHFNSDNIRIKNDVEVTVGAVSMYLKWLLHEQIPNSNCRDCPKKSTAPSQKEVYMAIAGYNWSPYSLHRLANKSTKQMRTGFPPPKETRSYFSKIDRCLAADNFDTFKQPSVSNESKSRGVACATSCE